MGDPMEMVAMPHAQGSNERIAKDKGEHHSFQVVQPNHARVVHLYLTTMPVENQGI